MRVIAGDIGGTKTRLALFDIEDGGARALAERRFESGLFSSLEEILRSFIRDMEGRPPEAAAFGIAGPVDGRRAHTTNLPWTVDADAIASAFGLPRVELLNDLEATAWGIGALPGSDLLTLQAGVEGARGNGAVIAAGTGLGEAGLFWDGRDFTPFATEGGHADFSPRSDLECALQTHLARRFEHVSWERVVSGPGLVEIFHFLRGHRRAAVPPELLARMARSDPAAVISAAASEENEPLCREAMGLFVALYGAEAGNLALKQMARGGLFIGGGIAPRILPWLSAGPFIEAFRAKGRMRPLMESMPVKVILNDRAALLGPARFLAR